MGIENFKKMQCEDRGFLCNIGRMERGSEQKGGGGAPHSTFPHEQVSVWWRRASGEWIVGESWKWEVVGEVRLHNGVTE